MWNAISIECLARVFHTEKRYVYHGQQRNTCALIKLGLLVGKNLFRVARFS